VRRGALRSLSVALVIGALGACGESAAVEQADARAIAVIDADRLPSELLGLQVKREDISEVLDKAKRP